MAIIGRYLSREIALGVGFVLLGFLALFAFFDFINELDDVGRGGYKVQHALANVLLGLPSHIYELMPIAVLIGAIYALAQFAQHSEFTAMRAAGLGRRRALVQVSWLGTVFVLVTFAVGEGLAPATEHLAQRMRLSALGATLTGQFRSGLWMKDTLRETGQPGAQRFVNVSQVMPDGTIRGVQVYEFDEQLRLRSVLRADSGRWSGAGNAPAWLLSDVRETRIVDVDAAGVMAVRAEQLQAAERRWRSELTPGIVGVLMIKPDRMAIWDLNAYISHLRENRQNADRYEAALWKKLVYPFAALVMMVLALPFAYLQVRAGGIGYKVFAGIMLGVAFHFLNGLFSHLGLLNTWPAWLSAALPSAAALMLGFGMLWWVERTR